MEIENFLFTAKIENLLLQLIRQCEDKMTTMIKEDVNKV